MDRIKTAFKRYIDYSGYFLRDLFFGALTGIAGGLVGAAFCHAIAWATGLRTANTWLVWLLPLGGLVIVFFYSLHGIHPTDTNGVLVAVRKPKAISASTGPLIFGGTVITHLFGGSAGREGAALQLGGVLGWHLARLFRQDEKDSHLLVMAGMSAVFAALFGTPVTAAVFAMEVISVGILHFSAIVPCLASALTASIIAQWLGVPSESIMLTGFDFAWGNLGGCVLIAVVCAVVSMLYCISLSGTHRLAKKYLPNPYIRIAVAGTLVALLSFAVGSGDYNGAGMHIIHKALHGEAAAEAFALKFLFTVITMACGFKGGEIVPAMFIGATLGCVLGQLMGLPAGLGAAVGLLSMFCGSLNCPLSSIFLGLELFGGANLPFYAIAAAVSFMLSENYGLYSKQKIMYSKLRPEFINSYTD